MMKSASRVRGALVLGCTLWAAVGCGALAGQDAELVDLQPEHFDLPEFQGYEVEYGSAFGRFFNQVRPFELEGASKVSVLNIIDMPGAVIVDSKVLDGETLRIEHTSSPFFAWGQEFIVARADADGFDWVRVPLEGGEPTRLSGTAEHGGFVDDLGFSPTMAALMPRPTGTKFQLPGMQPMADGTIATVLLDYEVVGTERLSLASGVECECWVIEQDAYDGVHRFWVSREAPFLIKRHRDVGGPRDFVSEVISYRPY